MGISQLTILLAIFLSARAYEGPSCIIPNTSLTSKCVLPQFCPSYVELLQAGKSFEASKYFYVCAPKIIVPLHVCCPDYAKEISTETSTSSGNLAENVLLNEVEESTKATVYDNDSSLSSLAADETFTSEKIADASTQSEISKTTSQSETTEEPTTNSPSNATNTSTSTTQKSKPVKQSPTTHIPKKNFFDQLKEHKNFNLINDKKCGVSSAPRIAGSENLPGVFRWVVLLTYDNEGNRNFTFGCGGSLISSSYVLTAASCVSDKLVSVRVGEHRISTELDCDDDDNCQDEVQDIKIANKTKHESYLRGIRQHDIALLKLQRPVDLSKKNVITICLPTSKNNQLGVLEPQNLNKLLVLGWGHIKNSKPFDVLKTGFIPYVNHSECAVKYRSYKMKIFETDFCAGGKNFSETCNSDSGGPIQTIAEINNKTRIIQYGVFSGGHSCMPDKNGEFKPGVYANIVYYLEWILDSME